MTNSKRQLVGVWWALLAVCLLSLGLLAFGSPAGAITKIPNPKPKPGSYGLEATKKQPPPKSGARIVSPGNGQSFSESPITVRGICPSGLLVEISNNGVMVGAVTCKNGQFSLEVSLFSGKNKLSAQVYDSTDQPGPKSNTVTVTYNNTNFTEFGKLVTLTSSYSRRGSSVGQNLSWPLQLSGGTGPYAITVNWGDGSTSDLKSQLTAGQFNINHVYERAGIYIVSINAVDKNGVSAFLQLVAMSNGKISAEAAGDGEAAPCEERVTILWIPAALALMMIPMAYWLGRRSQLVSLRKKMEKERDQYHEDMDR